MLFKIHDLTEGIQLLICFFLMGAATWGIVGISAQTSPDLVVSSAINSANIQRNTDDIKSVVSRQEAQQREIELLRAENLAIKELGGFGMAILALLKLIGLKINWSAMASTQKSDHAE